MGGFLVGLEPTKNQAFQHSAFAPASSVRRKAPLLRWPAPPCFQSEASEKGSILEKLVLFMPKNVKKTH